MTRAEIGSIAVDFVGGEHMPGKRGKAGVSDAIHRITLPLPADIDRRLRALAARRRTSVASVVRAWIVQQLDELTDDASPDQQHRR